MSINRGNQDLPPQDKDKTKELLINELGELRQRIAALEKFQSDPEYAGEELIRTRDFLDNIIESSLDCIIITDSSGNITRANKALFKLLDYKKEELFGMHVAELSILNEGTYKFVDGKEIQIDQEYVEYVKTSMKKLAEDGKIEYLRGYLIRKDKKVIPVEENIVCLYNKEKDVQGVLGIIRDITERKKTEKDLRETKNFLENVFSSSNDGIVISDEQGYMVSVNPVMEKMTRFTKNNLIGMHTSSILIDDKDMKKEVLESMGELFTKGSCFYEAKHITGDGSCIDVECNTSVIKDEKGNILGGVSVVRDVTERKRMQHQLQQTQKMEAIGTLAGGIAHDFNNILAAIIGYTEMNILHNFTDKVKAKKHSERVLQSAQRAKELVKQILTFSRTNEQEKKHVQVKSVVEETLKLIRATLPTTIEIQSAIETESSVMADSIQIQQLMMNLCTNSAHAMRDNGGLMKINLSEIQLTPEKALKYHDLSPGTFLKLTVSDTGSGIAPEIMNRIFDPFFTTKGVGDGTGMGLSLVHGIVKSHDGDITVDSKPGIGTTFQILLPRADKEHKKEYKNSNQIPRGTERILFVDDEELLVDVGQKLLESLGYKVISTSSSTKALEMFRDDPDKFDLVITDQTMPHMTGYTLAKKLMEIRPDIPVILCTGFSETVSPEQAKVSGIRALVMKPLTRKKMAEIIHNCFEEIQKGGKKLNTKLT